MERGLLPDPGPGQILLEAQWLSIDPYMRGRMDETASYSPPIAIGDVMVGRTISRVAMSHHPDFRVGDLVVATSGWQTRALSDGTGLRRLPANMARPTLALGVLGSSGFAAYIGIHDVVRLRHGETVVISAATGAVGATAVQIARRVGARVVAIAGGPEKVGYAYDVLGAHFALDHRASDFHRRLAVIAGDGIDAYFDNVGGRVLLAVTDLIKDRGRIAVCGLAAWYNLDGSEANADKASMLMRAILRKRLTVEGFVVIDWAHREEQFRRDMTNWIEAGEVRYREDVVDGLERAPEALIGLLEGRNFGKVIVRISSDASRG